MITRIIKKYDFSAVANKSAVKVDKSFVIIFKAVPNELEGVLLAFKRGFSVSVRDAADELDDNSLNYRPYADADGSCRIIEAVFETDHENSIYKISFPLCLAGDCDVEHEFAIVYNGVRAELVCNGKVMDREFPEGGFSGEMPCETASNKVKSFVLSDDLSQIKSFKQEIKEDCAIEFYTPEGFNSWFGDAVIYYYKGMFHIFYLFDRKHHHSRYGKGMHEFWHITSTDFKNWTDHGPIFEIEDQYLSVGTGNVFIYNDKLHLSFGLHTERVAPDENLRATSIFRENVAKLGHTGSFKYSETGDKLPSGASYVYTENGIDFVKSDTLMHFITNPSIFVQDDGTLRLIQVGTWESDHLGDWKLVDESFPVGWEKSFAHNCLDCPAIFQIGKWEYMMLGFTGMWGRKLDSGSEYIDFVEKGWDLYDGTNVPMYAELPDGRIIEGGWIRCRGWGGNLLLREIVSLGDGRIGKKFFEESLPEFENKTQFSGTCEIPQDKDCMIEFNLNGNEEIFKIVFEGDGKEFEFSLDCRKGYAEWTEVGKKVMCFRENALAHPEYKTLHDFKDVHFHGRDYAIENIAGTDKPFSIRLYLYHNRKWKAVLADAEIAGCRTMATNRNDIEVSRIKTTPAVKSFISFTKSSDSIM